MIVATAGHVNHGKTALIKALTGIDTTHLPEERRRNMTIELGFAELALGGDRFLSFIDVPGHARFVRNMLAGIAGVDLVMLVVAADDGIMPQTREHLQVIDLLGIPAGIAVITKTDLVPATQRDELARAIETLLAPTSLAGAPIFRVASGEPGSIDRLREHLIAAERNPALRRTGSSFRMPVDRRFVVKGAGVVVTGTIASGAVKVNDELVLMPEGRPLRVRGLQSHHVTAVECVAGMRCALNLTGPGFDLANVSRGDWIVAPAAAVISERVDVSIRTVTEAKLRSGLRVHFCHGASAIGARLDWLAGKEAWSDAENFAQLVLASPVHIMHGDRFILRDAAEQSTLGGGVVIDPFPPARHRRRPARLALLAAARESDPGAALMAMLGATEDGLDLDQFGRARNIMPAEIRELCDARGIVTVQGGERWRGFARDTWNKTRDALLHRVTRWPADHPDNPMPLASELLPSKGTDATPPVAQAALQSLLAEHRLSRYGPYVGAVGQKLTFGRADQQIWDRVAPYLAVTGRPLAANDIAAQTRIAPEAVEGILRKATRLGHVVHIAPGRYLSTTLLATVAAIAERLTQQDESRQFNVTQFRDASALGRNLSISVLEYFDRTGFTKRVGDRRRVLRSAQLFFPVPMAEDASP